MLDSKDLRRLEAGLGAAVELKIDRLVQLGRTDREVLDEVQPVIDRWAERRMDAEGYSRKTLDEISKPLVRRLVDHHIGAREALRTAGSRM